MESEMETVITQWLVGIVFIYSRSSSNKSLTLSLSMPWDRNDECKEILGFLVGNYPRLILRSCMLCWISGLPETLEPLDGNPQKGPPICFKASFVYCAAAWVSGYRFRVWSYGVHM